MLFDDQEVFAPTTDVRQYDPKVKKPKVSCIPQLRLFVTELAFLTFATTRCKKDNCVVVYAGAATGNHITALAELFPRISFHLYDSSTFAIQSTKQVVIHHEYFCNQTAQEWKTSGKTIFFISDIRSVGTTGEEYEEEINYDMLTQAYWIQLMEPEFWSLKFRIPYPVVNRRGKYPYFGGILFRQPFTKTLSMELRLVGNAANIREGPTAVQYDSHHLEQLLFHHNTVVRPERNRYLNIYSRDTQDYIESGFNRGFDITYLLHVIDSYLVSLNIASDPRIMNEHNFTSYVKTLVNKVSGGHWSLIEHRKEYQKTLMRPLILTPIRINESA